MEGAKRPGHFNGVCQIVSRLFYITRPNRAYFGEKDWQQIAVIKRLVEYLGLQKDIEIVECPIVRDKDGLAKSSRNTLLTNDERAIAPNISGLEVEYFSIVDGNTLLDVTDWKESSNIVGCITVYCGKTPIRLIDHIKYRG